MHLDNIGRVCMGPLSTSFKGNKNDSFVQELCPRNCVIGLDTAKLEVTQRADCKSYKGQKLSLPPSCESCDAQKHLFSDFIHSNKELLSEPTECFAEGCEEPRRFGATHCVRHLSDPSCNTGPEVPRLRHLRKLYAQIRRDPLEQWTIPTGARVLKQRKSDIEAGKMPAAGLLAVDVEFSPIKEAGLQPVLELYVHAWNELEPIIDAVILPEDTTINEPIRTIVNRGLEVISMKEVGRRLQSAGVTKDSYMISYGSNKRDQSIVDDHLKNVGIEGVWPTKDNVFMPFTWLDGNVKSGENLSLGVVFNAFFGEDHPLGRQLHRAKPDTKMLMHLFELLSSCPIGSRRYPSKRWSAKGE